MHPSSSGNHLSRGARALVAVVAISSLTACGGGQEPSSTKPSSAASASDASKESATPIEPRGSISREAYEAALEQGGCIVVAQDTPFAGEAAHHDPSSAASADAMYADQVRPAHSGPHFFQTHPKVTGFASDELDERAVVHNLEHGAVAVWSHGLDAAGTTEIDGWQRSRTSWGFESPRAGAYIVASAWSTPLASGKSVAFRAWGQAIDCDTWNIDVADGFLVSYWADRGIAPEGNMAAYPDGALNFA